MLLISIVAQFTAEWLIMTGRNSDYSPTVWRNGQAIVYNTGGMGDSQLAINTGAVGGEKSTCDVSFVEIYDSWLTNTQVDQRNQEIGQCPSLTPECASQRT